MCDAIDRYFDLRGRIDRRAAELLARHGRNIPCHAGCCDCCVDLSVFPVEYHAIRTQLRRAGVTALPRDPGASCGYLRDGRCVLYAARPLICRTHGPPVSWADEEAPAGRRAAASCPKTFGGADPEALDFGPDDTLDLDRLNAELFEINLAFLRHGDDGDIDPTRRIPLSRLADDLAAAAGGAARG